MLMLTGQDETNRLNERYMYSGSDGLDTMVIASTEVKSLFYRMCDPQLALGEK